MPEMFILRAFCVSFVVEGSVVAAIGLSLLTFQNEWRGATGSEDFLRDLYAQARSQSNFQKILSPIGFAIEVKALFSFNALEL